MKDSEEFASKIISKEDLFFLFNINSLKNEMILYQLYYSFNKFLSNKEEIKEKIIEIAQMVLF